MRSPENLLIVRTDRIGDVILSLPLAGIVKKHYPECRVTFLVREYTFDLVSGHPHIDEVITLTETDGKPNIFHNVRELEERNLDSGIVVYPTFRTALILFLSRIKIRIGTGYRWYSFLFNRRVYEHRKYAEKHELEFNVNMLRQIGIQEEINKENIRFDLVTDPNSSQKISELFSEHGVSDKRPIVIIHPGSGGSAIDLPLEKMRELIKILSENEEITVILTGNTAEKELCDQIMYGDNIFNLAGLLTLSELIALINRCTVFVSNSTGPIHIASALGKNVIGFYPKILACSHKRWGPYTVNAAVFTPTIECSYCGREQCEKLDCMNSIDMMKVYTQLKNFIKSS